MSISPESTKGKVLSIIADLILMALWAISSWAIYSYLFTDINGVARWWASITLPLGIVSGIALIVIFFQSIIESIKEPIEHKCTATNDDYSSQPGMALAGLMLFFICVILPVFGGITLLIMHFIA